MEGDNDFASIMPYLQSHTDLNSGNGTYNASKPTSSGRAVLLSTETMSEIILGRLLVYGQREG